MWSGLPGRPLEDRHALARAFVAKAVLNLPTTTSLIERLAVDATLCGWERASQVPSESTFSRAFAEFAASALPGRVHEALIKRPTRIVSSVTLRATPLPSRRARSRCERHLPLLRRRSASVAGRKKAR